ncbi:MAG: ABC transporter ATP-binding protein [Thaumarchaeota archaeon]|nr:ABC transporter ATP-binding protein [Nitrososphaerota archaeon]
MVFVTDVVIQNVGKSFKEVVAVDSVSIDVKQGELYGILGQTGAGKTTLLRMIAGLDKPDRGVILIGGVPREKIRVGSGDVQIVFQDFALWPHMTVSQNLSFPLKQRKLSGKEIMDRVGEVSSKIGLPTHLHSRTPSQLSDGQRQMVAIGRALVVNPKVLLLDEPFSHLDPITKLKIRDELIRMQHSDRLTIIMVTHQLSDAMALADRIAVMLDGRILQVSTPDDLNREQSDPYVSAYIRSYSLLPKRKA